MMWPRVVPRAAARWGVRWLADGYKYFGNRQEPALSTPVGQQRALMAGGAFLALCGAYYVAHLEPVPVTNRRRFIAVSPQRELKMGEQVFQQMLAKYQSKILPPNHPVVRRIEAIGQRLIDVSPLNDNVPWTFHVVDEPIANCFVIPGRHVFVFTGILPILRDDDGVAVVMGHEIAHQVARHSAEKLSIYQIIVVMESLLALAFNIPRRFSHSMATLAMELPFSRTMETEADHIGITLVAKACFNPTAAMGVFRRLDEHMSSSGTVEKSFLGPFLSTHPAHDARVQQFKVWMPEATDLVQKHCRFKDNFMRIMADLDNSR